MAAYGIASMNDHIGKFGYDSMQKEEKTNLRKGKNLVFCTMFICWNNET